MSQTATCPACAEEIKAEARKCKHCGEWLDGSQPLQTSAPVQLPDVSEEVARGLRRKELSDERANLSYGTAGFLAFLGGVGVAAVTGLVWVGVVAFLILVAVLGAKAEKERNF